MLFRASALLILSTVTCAVKGEEEEEQAGDQVPQESDHATGDAFRDGVHRFDEKLKEDGHAAVDENAHQNAGGVQDGCKKKTALCKNIQIVDDYGSSQTL